ncbi:Maf family protein, partial [Dokdonella sp.]|uniref:Maf family protein n=1 Tax=Dokdonella sp. TaxID=2291710 RepID=UPI002F3E20EF
MSRLGDVDLVLGSTSRYRRDLLSRLTTSFRVHAPAVDETPHAGEAPAALARRLAAAKAHAVATACAGAVVIGSDQVAELDGRALGKPGTAANACAQLRACSGRTVEFHTALCLGDARGAAPRAGAECDLTRVVFRTLDDAEIERYV